MPNVGTASVDLDVDGQRLGHNIRSAVDRESAGISSHFHGLGRMGGDALTAGFSGALRLVEKVGLATGLASVALGGFGLKAAGDFQQTRIAFEGILGSAEKAQAMLTDLRDFAAKTPFEFPELATASKSLLAVGFEAKDVIPIMTKLGNVAATLGVGGEAINGVVRALGQMKGKGKASAEELNQISEQIPGFSAVKAIAEDMGISVEAAFKLMETGALPADRAISAILKGMEKFPGAAGAMQRQSKTLNGVISTLKDTFRDALINGIEPFLPAIAGGLERSAPLLKRAVSGLVGIVTGGIGVIKGFVLGLTTGFTENELQGGVAGFFERLGMAGFKLVGQFKEAWPEIKATVTGAVSGFIAYIQENWPKIEGVFVAGFDAVKGAAALVEPLFRVVLGIAKDLVDKLPLLSGALGGLGDAFRIVGGFIGDHIEGFKQLAELIGVIMVARLVALKVQLAITFGASVIESIVAFGVAITGASVATAGAGAAGGAGAGGLAAAGAAAGLSLGGLVVAVGLVTGGLVILARTVDDRVPSLKKLDSWVVSLEEKVPGVGKALGALDRAVLGLGDSSDGASGKVKSLHDQLLDYARGYRAELTIDTSQAYRSLDQLRSDLSTINANIDRSGPGGGNRAAANDVESQIASREAPSQDEGTTSGAQRFAHGMDMGPVRGPYAGAAVPVVAHAGEWVLTPEQMDDLTSSRSGGGAGTGAPVIIEVPLIVNGREFARAMSGDIAREFTNMARSR